MAKLNTLVNHFGPLMGIILRVTLCTTEGSVILKFVFAPVRVLLLKHCGHHCMVKRCMCPQLTLELAELKMND